MVVQLKQNFLDMKHFSTETTQSYTCSDVNSWIYKWHVTAVIVYICVSMFDLTLKSYFWRAGQGRNSSMFFLHLRTMSKISPFQFFSVVEVIHATCPCQEQPSTLQLPHNYAFKWALTKMWSVLCVQCHEACMCVMHEWSVCIYTTMFIGLKKAETQSLTQYSQKTERTT